MKLFVLLAALVGEAAAFGRFSDAVGSVGGDADSGCGRGDVICDSCDSCEQSGSFSMDELNLEPITAYLADTMPGEDSSCGCDQAGVILACALPANSTRNCPPFQPAAIPFCPLSLPLLRETRGVTHS